MKSKSEVNKTLERLEKKLDDKKEKLASEKSKEAIEKSKKNLLDNYKKTNDFKRYANKKLTDEQALTLLKAVKYLMPTLLLILCLMSVAVNSILSPCVAQTLSASENLHRIHIYGSGKAVCWTVVQ